MAESVDLEPTYEYGLSVAIMNRFCYNLITSWNLVRYKRSNSEVEVAGVEV